MLWDSDVRRLVRDQDGLLTTAQARACGITESAIRARLAAGRWQRVRRGVYATFSGPLPRRCQLWAALLAAGADAVLSHDSAAELWGMAVPRAGQAAIHVTVPEGRKVARMAGVVVHRSRRPVACHPAQLPPRTRIEETVIDLTQAARTLQDAFGWLARAVNDRLTTADRLLEALADRPRVRWRRLLREGLGDVAAGCRSVLEVGYLREVERAHGLPTGERQSRATGSARGGSGATTGATARIYVDVRYRRFGVRVELDGRAAHPTDQAFRDMWRDNDAVVAGERPLRYGMPDVHERPCVVAKQVAAVLTRAGWDGTPLPCPRPDCAMR